MTLYTVPCSSLRWFASHSVRPLVETKTSLKIQKSSLKIALLLRATGWLTGVCTHDARGDE
eukprot:scaffold299917_cov19-Prasinocladus_malaysianus.AAC.1